MDRNYLSVTALGSIISARLTDPSLRNVWVAGELSDVRISGGHCYMELADKDKATGRVSARIRGAIWANVFARLAAKFGHATGRQIATGLKVMVCGTVSYHPAFGITFVITDIDPSYTMGEVERRRREILEQLQKDGVLEMNRSLPWNTPTLRVAVISAPGAAGYGDFINQLYSNHLRLRFTVRLFAATMQGDRTVPSVMAALTEIAADVDSWDCVVLIRGGGATTDLLSFDDYSLASAVAQFPVPVIVGIGHERDITVLDYVAAIRVKTPTAAAEYLISKGTECLDRLKRLGADILSCSNDMIAGCRTRLAYCEGALPSIALNSVTAARQHIDRGVLSLATLGSRRIMPQLTHIEAVGRAIATAANATVARRFEDLESKSLILNVLSPVSTLKRGYTITRINGHAVTSAEDIPLGASIITSFADGEITSTVTKTPKS